MKKIFLIISAMMILLSCGKKEVEKADGGGQAAPATEIKPENGATLKVWESKGKEADWIKYVAEEFEKKYNVKVTYENVEAPDVVKKLQTEGKTELLTW